MTLRENWINLLYRVATGTRKTRTLLTPVGALIFAVFTTLFVLAALLFDRMLGMPGLLSESMRFPVSIPVIALGIIITGWSAFHFVKVRGTPVPFNPPPQLVCSGPYRYVRNPMLTGIFLFLLGLGFGLNSMSLVLIFIPLYVLVNVWEVKHIEEPELVKRFGDAYVTYRQKTPMFIPGYRPHGMRKS